MLPSTWVQVLVVIVIVVPGFVYQVAHRRVRGPDPDERDVSIRILRAIASSGTFALVYLVALGPEILSIGGTSPEITAENVREVAFLALLLIFVIPLIAAYLAFFVTTAEWWISLRDQLSAWTTTSLRIRSRWDPTPSAWDYAFATLHEPHWVRILTSDGKWIGGYYGHLSFASTYPESQDIFLEKGYAINADGEFTGDVSAPEGLYVRCSDIRLADFKIVDFTSGTP